MQVLITLFVGIITGSILTFGGLFARGLYLERRTSFMPAEGAKVVYDGEGFAYWRNENGFFVAPLIDDQPDFKRASLVDAYNAPAEELDKLMEIISHLE